MKLIKYWHMEFFFCGHIFLLLVLHLLLQSSDKLLCFIYNKGNRRGPRVFIHTSYLINDNSKKQELSSCYKSSY